MDLDVLLKRYRKHEVIVGEIPRYPSVKRDLALVLDKDVPYRDVEKVINKVGGRLLSEVNLFDVYVDDQLKGQNRKSYAISMTFIDEEKSLRDKEVDKVIQKMIQQCHNQLGAQIR